MRLGYGRPAVTRFPAAQALVALVLLAGCGGDGPSREEFAQEVDARTRAVAQLFDQTGRALATLEGDASGAMEREIPQAGRERLRELAAAQRRAAREIDALEPPEGAERATAELADALREHAGRIETTAEREDLTFDGWTAASAAPPELTRAVHELRDQGMDVARPLPGGGL